MVKPDTTRNSGYKAAKFVNNCRKLATLAIHSQSLQIGILTSLFLPIAGAAANAQSALYSPIPLNPGATVTDNLSGKDIPTGQGGFARDYVVQLKEGTQLAIDLASDNFDTIVGLLASDGSTVAENDDGPDGSTNSLLFTRISKTGTYYIRVRSFGEMTGGSFKLKVTLLKPL